MILFHGAIGSAYNSLYEPFLPMKDEIEELTDVHPKSPIDYQRDSSDKQEPVHVLTISTGAPLELLKEFIKKVKDNEIKTWVLDEEGDFTTKRDDWRMKCWVRFKPDDGKLNVYFIPSKKFEFTQELKGIFIGRVISTMYAKFQEHMKELSIEI